MRIIMSDDIVEINAENFVIKLFDAIKCAATNDSSLDIKLTREEVRALGVHIKNVNWIEINEIGG